MINDVETSTQFRRTRWRTGYSAREVDAFTAEVEIALFSPEPRVRSSDVAWQQFTEVRRKAGYDTEDVDRYLEEVQRRLSEAEHRREPDPFTQDVTA
jgi:DivIVA domain-containing protein